MPLSAGTRLGPYEIVSPLGAGGSQSDSAILSHSMRHDFRPGTQRRVPPHRPYLDFRNL